eukprot:TRINITY_DN54808_c0_g1_i1.p1 TRINITY_DN54808_c0_g1~~TRINITY_DN54808_c0_g1_i1.p1  ORF type:complete len:353 (+),score=66.79 TRINITY_DN54808_c0_g1_i1:84-1061(+)
MRRALHSLETWLLEKGKFVFHRADDMQGLWRVVKASVPPDCLTYSHGVHGYGSPGWLRVFAPHFWSETKAWQGVRSLLWVDAGDYIFLEDPAELAKYQGSFSPQQLLGVPFAHHKTVQLYDLQKLQNSDWTQLVADAVRSGYARHGKDHWCSLGEGNTLNELASRHADLFFHMPSSWSYEPWYELVDVGYGVVDFWTKKGGRMREAWKGRAFMGQSDFLSLQVHCPDWLETFVACVKHAWRARHVDLVFESCLPRANAASTRNLLNQSFTDSQSGQELTCGQRVHAVHFVSRFKALPWAVRFLNFWAGANVWNETRPARDLRLDV